MRLHRVLAMKTYVATVRSKSDRRHTDFLVFLKWPCRFAEKAIRQAGSLIRLVENDYRAGGPFRTEIESPESLK